MPFITLANVAKIYRHGSQAVHALTDFSLAIDNGEFTKPVAKATSPAQQPRSAVTSTAAQAKVEEPLAPIYAYSSAGRRDPFTPIIIKEEKKTLAGAKAPLERYPINEFKLVGVIWGGLGYHAMMEGPDGKGYFIRQGTKIGPSQGVVKKITQTTMVIEEKYKDPRGNKPQGNRY